MTVASFPTVEGSAFLDIFDKTSLAWKPTENLLFANNVSISAKGNQFGTKSSFKFTPLRIFVQ